MAQTGDVLAGRYHLEERLGRGGMAEVFRADDVVLERPVAVKLLPGHLEGNPAAVRRLRREAHAIAALNHPNVVAVYDVIEELDAFGIVMELLPGPTLAEVLTAEGPLPLSRAVELTAQVADGLAAAHSQGIVHRDVKPSNVMMAEDGRATVTDFGIAGAMEATAWTGPIRGSVPYLAPEQASGNPPEPRTDVYALGCLLFESLTGRPPFTGTTMEVFGQHLHASPPHIADLRGGVPAALDEIVTRSLSKDPNDRYPDVAAFRRALLAAVPVGDAATVVLPADETMPVHGTLPLGAAAMPFAPAARAPAVREPVDGAPVPTAAGRVGRRRLLVLGLLGVLAAVLLLNLAAIDRPGGGSVLEATPVPTPPPSPPPTPSPTPSPTPTATTPEQLVDDLAQAIAAGRAQGQLSDDAVKKLEDRVRELRRALRRGQPDERRDKALEEVDKLEEAIDDLLDDGELSAAFAETLEGYIDRLEDVI